MSNIFTLPADDSSYHVTYPVAQYDHDEGNAISGGFEYWGKNVPELQGKYIFGDIVKGRVFYVEMADLKLRKQATIKGTEGCVEWKSYDVGGTLWRPKSGCAVWKRSPG